jgi:hypothetical protein
VDLALPNASDQRQRGRQLPKAVLNSGNRVPSRLAAIPGSRSKWENIQKNHTRFAFGRDHRGLSRSFLVRHQAGCAGLHAKHLSESAERGCHSRADGVWSTW